MKKLIITSEKIDLYLTCLALHKAKKYEKEKGTQERVTVNFKNNTVSHRWLDIVKIASSIQT